MNKNQLLKLMLLFVLCFSISNSFGQEQPDFSKPYSADTLKMVYASIDQMSIFDLEKWRESYIYRSRVAPTEQNKEILNYIEKRRTAILNNLKED